jgi:hypothetical protein
MKGPLSELITRLHETKLPKTHIIPWSCPIPSFGDIFSAKVATLGLNPSNREFVDETGSELIGVARRFHTLRSLGLGCWSDARRSHAKLIWDSCRTYFSRNPYDIWFKQLDNVIGGTTASYYSVSNTACHLDLIPYATVCKWTDLNHQQRQILFTIAADTLAVILRQSSVKLLVLNGRSVVANFERMAGIQLEKQLMKEWSLPRRLQAPVAGIGYTGSINQLFGIALKRRIAVIGFNHNIQSSFGVTKTVKTSIRSWVAQAAGEML